MARIEAVVFDLGGVLIDWNPHYLYRSLIPDDTDRKRFLSEVCTMEWNHGMDAGRSVEASVAALADAHPGDAHLVRAWWDRWPEMLGGEIAGSLAIAHDLEARGIPLYALTNWAADTWPFAVERFAFLTSLFEGIVVSGQEGVAKPDREIFERLLSRFGLVPSTTAYIDDSEPNVATAVELGFASHRFVDPVGLQAWISELLPT